jgi:hypothetical protein
VDYKKIAVYLLIILVGLGLWYRSKVNEARRAEQYNRFAELYAVTSVMAELYRKTPQQFYPIRDSLYRHYRMDADSVAKLKKTLEGREEEWLPIWEIIKQKMDSLMAYYRDHPLGQQPDSISPSPDSLPAAVSDTVR